MDIVERLRDTDGMSLEEHVMAEAADEIEALRQRVKWLDDKVDALEKENVRLMFEALEAHGEPVAWWTGSRYVNNTFAQTLAEKRRVGWVPLYTSAKGQA